MKVKTAINKALLVALLVFPTPFVAFGANIPVDNAEAPTVNQLQDQLISLILEQIRMLEEQIKQIKEEDKKTEEVAPAPVIEDKKPPKVEKVKGKYAPPGLETNQA